MQRIDYEKNKPQLEMFLNVLVTFVIEKLTQNQSVDSVITLTEEYLKNNIKTICEKTNIPFELLQNEMKINKENLAKNLVNLISPVFKVMINVYNNTLLTRIEKALSNAFTNIEQK